VTERYRWAILGAGTFAQSSFSAVSVGLPALAPSLRSHYRLSLGETGVVLGSVGIGMLLTLLAWGLLADRIGERAVIALGLTSGGVAMAATGRTGSYPALVGMLVVSGALGAGVNAASGRAVMSWFGAEERGLALGIRQAAVPVGGAVAAAALPWLASAGGTKLAFEALGAGCIAGGVVAGVLMREAPARALPHPAAGGRPPLRDARMWLLAGGSSLYLAAQIAILSFVVLFLHEHRGLSTHAAAAVLATINVLGIGARIGIGRWSDRAGARLAPLRTIGLALAVGTILTAVLVDAPLALLVPALIVAGVLGLSWNGLSFTAAAERAGLARSGAALGFQQTMLGVLGAAVPPAFAVFVGATSWRVAFAVSAAGPVLGVLLLRRVPEPTRSLSGGRRRGTSAIPPAAR
jgi:sugar phosphate permease